MILYASVLLHYLLISNYQLMDDLIEYCGKISIQEIFQIPDVQERVKRYFEQNDLFEQMILKSTRTDGNVIITDLRGEELIYSGNRFLIYSLYPTRIFLFGSSTAGTSRIVFMQ